MNPIGNPGMNIGAYYIKNQGTNAISNQLSKQALEMAENSIPEIMRASRVNRDIVEISGQKPAVPGGTVTLGDIPITMAEKNPIKTSTKFTNQNVSKPAQELAALMDENSEDLYFKLCSGMSEKQLADHVGSIGKQIDDAFAAGAISQQEYDDLNLGLKKYTDVISCKAEREAATWAVAKQCAQATRAKIESGASDKEMVRYAEEHKASFHSKIDQFIKGFCSIDRSLLADLIQHVQDGTQLFPEGTKHTYSQENTIGYFKTGYVPFIPAKYP